MRRPPPTQENKPLNTSQSYLEIPDQIQVDILAPEVFAELRRLDNIDYEII